MPDPRPGSFRVQECRNGAVSRPVTRGGRRWTAASRRRHSQHLTLPISARIVLHAQLVIKTQPCCRPPTLARAHQLAHQAPAALRAAGMLLQTITRLPSLREFRCRRLEDGCPAGRRPLAAAPSGRRRPAVAAAASEGGSAPPPLPRLKVLRAQAPSVAPATGPPAAAPALPARQAVLRVEPEAVAPWVNGQQLLRQVKRLNKPHSACWPAFLRRLCLRSCVALPSRPAAGCAACAEASATAVSSSGRGCSQPCVPY